MAFIKVGRLIYETAYDKNNKRLDGQYKRDDKNRPKLKIVFDKKTKVIIDGVDCTGKSLEVDYPDTKYKRFVAAGKMTEDEAMAEIAKHEKGGEFEYVRAEIQLKLRDVK